MQNMGRINKQDKDSRKKIFIKEKSERESERWWNQDCWVLKTKAKKKLREVKNKMAELEEYKKARNKRM